MRFTLTIALLLFILDARSETFYFTHNALGGEASSPSTATNFGWFNTSGNWGSGAGKISAGDTVVLVGTVATNLNFQGGGTPGSPVTLLFAAGAKIAAPALSGNIINLNGNCNVIIDGGATGRIGGYTGQTNLANGLIANPATGTALGSSNDCTGIFAQQSTNVLIQNLAFIDLYARLSGAEANGYGAGILSRWNGGVSPSGITVSNCYLDNMAVGFSVDYGPNSQDIYYLDCTAKRVNWGGNAGDHGSGSVLSNLVVRNLYAAGFTNWDQPANSYHHNGFYAWAESGGTLLATTYENSVIEGGFSVGSPNNQTSSLFFSGAGAFGPLNIRNCLFMEDGNGNGPSNGHIFIWAGASFVGYIDNNTFLGKGGGNAIQLYGGRGTAGQQQIYVRNNVATNKTFINLAIHTNMTVYATNNHGFGLVSGQEYSRSTTSSSSFMNLQSWQALGYDTTSTNTDPKLGTLGRPQSDSPLIGAASVLNAQFTTDAEGTLRGTSWDLGWLEYVEPSSRAFSTQIGGRGVTFGGRGVELR